MNWYDWEQDYVGFKFKTKKYYDEHTNNTNLDKKIGETYDDYYLAEEYGALDIGSSYQEILDELQKQHNLDMFTWATRESFAKQKEEQRLAAEKAAKRIAAELQELKIAEELKAKQSEEQGLRRIRVMED